jgi:serine/threonine protein kinase
VEMTEDAIFDAAVGMADPKARAAFLEKACGGDEVLRRRVEARLAAQPATLPGATLGTGSAADYTSSDSTLEAASSSASKEGAGSLIGPYKLVQPIGAGGMGMVYLADQMHPVRRQVALKIIKQGMDTEQVIVRFEAERQALALMDHPNIAKVLDAGTTESGRPYFVMELVKGVPITKYCDTNRLTVRERLELFVPVCQAIQHAHQKGIIHRDIKPSNVLVASYDGKPVPKVIDFGIAKATGVGLTDQTVFTQIGAVIGTLEYMSPEQAESTALDIDTRSDIYSLGALLYELLTGSTPMESAEFRKAAYVEVLRKIREEEPPSPSSRLSHSKETLTTTSEQRKTDPGRLPKLLAGELDWIVMKALEKDRTRRYETANGFARDIERYLSGDPVEAGPPSATYRLKKFANKNKVLIGTVSAFAALLILGVVVSTWQAVRATRSEKAAKAERDRADAEAATSKAVTDFLQNSLLSQASAQQQSGLNEKPDPDMKVRTLLDRAAATIGEKFKDQPLVEAGVRSTIGMTYRDLNLIPQAEEQLQKAYDLSLRYRAPDDPDTLQFLEGVASIKWDEGKPGEALPQEKSAYEGMLRLLGPEDHRTVRAMQSLGVFYLAADKYEEAEPLLKKALEIQIRTLGYDNVDTLNTSDSLATLYRFQEKYAEADPLFEKGLASYRKLYGPEHPYTLREMYGLAANDIGEHKYAEAEPLLIQVLEGNTKLLGAEHPDTLATMSGLARLYEKEGKFAQAEAGYKKIIEGFSRALGPDHPYTLMQIDNLGSLYWLKTHQYDKSIALFQDEMQRETRTIGPNAPNTLNTEANLVAVYLDAGKFAESSPLLTKCVEDHKRVFGPEDRRTQAMMVELGKNDLKLKRFVQAEGVLREVLVLKEKTEPDKWGRFYAQSSLGAALAGEKKFAEAEPLLAGGYEGLKQRESKLDPEQKKYLVEAGERVVAMYQAWGKPEKAAEWRAKLNGGGAASPATKH